MSLFVTGAVLGEGQVSLFVAGAILGEGQVSLFVAGAVLGEGQVSLFVAGAVLGEIWKDSRSAKCCIFQHKMLALSAKSNLCCAAGCGLPGSWSERSRNGLGSAAYWKCRFTAILTKFLPDVGWLLMGMLQGTSHDCCCTKKAKNADFWPPKTKKVGYPPSPLPHLKF